MVKNNFKILGLISIFMILINICIGQKCECLAKDAIKHNEEFCKVTGTVVDIFVANNKKGKPTFLNIGDKFPNQDLKVMIWESDLKNFSKSLDSLYQGKTIAVYGLIKIFNDKPSITIRKESDIEILKSK